MYKVSILFFLVILAGCSGARTFDSQLQAAREKDRYLSGGRYKVGYFKKYKEYKNVDSDEYTRWEIRVHEINYEHLQWCKQEVRDLHEEGGLEARIKLAEESRDYAVARGNSVDYAEHMHSELIAELKDRVAGGEQQLIKELNECDKNFKERMADAPNNFPFKGPRYKGVTVYKKKKDYKYENYRTCSREKSSSYEQFVCFDERRPNSVKIFRY